MRAKEEREGVIPLPNLPLPPPPALLLAFSPATTIYVDSKENNGAESDTLIPALEICEFHYSYV